MIDNFEMISLSCASRFSWESHSLSQVQIFASIADDIKLLYLLYDLHKMVKSKRNFLSWILTWRGRKSKAEVMTDGFL